MLGGIPNHGSCALILERRVGSGERRWNITLDVTGINRLDSRIFRKAEQELTPEQIQIFVQAGHQSDRSNEIRRERQAAVSESPVSEVQKKFARNPCSIGK